MKDVGTDSGQSKVRKLNFILFSRKEIPEEYHSLWIRKRWEYNRRFLRISAILCILGSAALILRRVFLVHPGEDTSLNHLFYFVFGTIGVVSAIYLSGFFFGNRSYRRFYEVVQHLFITTYLVLFGFLSNLDMQMAPDFSALIIAILFLSVAFWLNLFTYLGYLVLIAGLTVIDYLTGVHVSVTGSELFTNLALFMAVGFGMFYAVSDMRIRNFITSRQLESSIEDMKELSLRDPLTRLYNRRMMNEELDREIAFSRRTGQPLTIFLIDVDHFKRINDSLGHSIGDDVLRQCADRLVEAVRESDRVYRFGGEEFILMLPNSSLPSTRNLADRLLVGFSDVPFDGVPWPITVSIGIADNTERLLPADLIKLADCRMYLSKQSGRNCYDSTGCTDSDADTDEPVIP